MEERLFEDDDGRWLPASTWGSGAPSSPVPEMVKRVARALCRSYVASEYEGDDIEKAIDLVWDEYVDDARAAIEAMRPSTAWMNICGRAVMPEHDEPLQEDAAATWGAMVEAALNHESGYEDEDALNPPA